MLPLGLIAACGLRAAPPAEPVERIIDAEFAASGAPGVAYAVVDNGAIRSGARGTVLAGSGRPVTPDTPFLIGSITKSFTALAIMQLVEAGKVELDAGVGTYLRDFRGQAAGAITVRQLLSHTSGYSTVQGNTMHKDPSSGADALAEHVAQVAGWEPAYPPGARWEYSNANYQILGRLVETVSEARFADYIAVHILRPLGMTHSFVSEGLEPAEVAIGHRPWFGGHRAYQSAGAERANAPAGGLYASANDLARYLAMMLDGEDDIVSADSKAAMLRPASGASPFYGLGWFIDTDAGSAYHGGLVPGTETLATLVPAEKRAVVVLVNSNGGLGFGENLQLRNGVTAAALGRPYRGEGMGFGPKLAFLSIATLPLFFLGAMVWAWRHRSALRAKSGPAGVASVWFPVCATLAMAVFLLTILPRMFGGSLDTLFLFQPDFALVLVSGGILGLSWAAFRLVLSRMEMWNSPAPRE